MYQNERSRTMRLARCWKMTKLRSAARVRDGRQGSKLSLRERGKQRPGERKWISAMLWVAFVATGGPLPYHQCKSGTYKLTCKCKLSFHLLYMETIRQLHCNTMRDYPLLDTTEPRHLRCESHRSSDYPSFRCISVKVLIRFS